MASSRLASRAAAFAVILWAVVLAPGCELFSPTTVSPRTGQRVTMAQLEAEQVAAEREAEGQARQEALAAQAELARVQREAEYQILREQAASDARLAEIRFEAESRMDGVRVDLESRAEARAATLEGMRASYAAARSDLEAKAGFLADAAGVAQGFIGSAPVQAAAAANPLIAGGLAIAGLVFGRWTRGISAKTDVEKQAKLDEAQKQRELAELRAQLLAEMKALADKTWDDAKAEARNETLVNNATWDEAVRDTERRALLSIVPKTTAA